jgi:predicted membrane-bound dolichyl-phosphate-mannose-protein mannosyltransferase
VSERHTLRAQREPRPLTEPGTVDAAAQLATPEVSTTEDAWDRLARVADRLLPSELHLRLLWLLLVVSVLLRLLWLARPEGSLIFDESYYVNAARVILGLPPGQDRYQGAPFGLDPNTEHPPLAKLLVAGSMAVLGDNAYGWRVPSVLAGMASILLMYGIGRQVATSPYVALLAAGLLAFDNLVFVHSRIFTLDIFQLTFMLLGLFWYVRGRATLAGVGFALAALCKIGGVFGLVAMCGYEALRLLQGNQPWTARWRPAARRLIRMTVTFGLSFLLLLGVMDRLWVGYSQPFEHLNRIFSYGTALRRQVPSGIESYPWQWLWNDVEIPYLRVEQQVRVGEEVRENRPIILFLGAMNPYVLQLWPFGLAFAAWAWWRRRPDAELGALALAWFACTYLPFYAATLFGQRISYLFYFLPSLPAVALAGSYFLLGAGLPRLILWVYLAAVLLGFYGYFPFKPVP